MVRSVVGRGRERHTLRDVVEDRLCGELCCGIGHDHAHLRGIGAGGDEPRIADDFPDGAGDEERPGAFVGVRL